MHESGGAFDEQRERADREEQAEADVDDVLDPGEPLRDDGPKPSGRREGPDPLQTTAGPGTDSGANKLFELLVACFAMQCGTDVALDDPDSSKGDNPDVLVTVVLLLATLIIGILGSVIGAGVLIFFSGLKVTPISIVGFPVALVGTMLILLTYRLLSGRGMFKDGFARFGMRGGHHRKVIVEE